MPLAPDLAVRFDAVLAGHGLTRWRTALLEAARPSVVFTSAPVEALSSPGDSRLGGLPDLPPGADWPDGMAFLAQLNLAAVPLAALGADWPTQGRLWFFVGDDEAYHGVPHRVIYSTAPSAELIPATAPPRMQPISRDGPLGGGPDTLYEPRRILAQASVSVPPHGSPAWRALLERHPDATHDELEGYLRLLAELQVPRPSRQVGRNRIGGHPEQGDDDDPRVAATAWLAETFPAEPATTADDWLLLLELDSDYELGTCFWDAGQLQFFVLAQDLRDRRFDRPFAAIHSP